MPPQLRKRRPPPPKEPVQRSPANTAANNWARLRRYAAYLQRSCLEMSTAKDIYSQLKGMSCQFRDDFFAVCTESGTQPCHLLDKFDSWNLFLQEINMELSETEPGRLGLNRAHVRNKMAGKKRSYLLLHWLLTQHCCIKTLLIQQSFAPDYLRLLCDALHLSCGLEELALKCDLDDEAHKIIIPAIATMLKSLVKLRMSAYKIPGCALGSLGAALQKSPGLATLNLRGIPIDAHNAELLLSGLATCSSLVELSIEDYFLLPREGAALAEFVAESTALKQLCLTCAVCFEMKQLGTFLKGLASNFSLEKLCLDGFDVEKEKPAMDLFVEVVAHHSSLKILDINCTEDQMDGNVLAELIACNTGLRELVFSFGGTGCVAALARAIRKNTRLQRLQLDLIGMDMHDYRELLMALSCNRALQELEFYYVCDFFLADLCQLMQETGTEGRVKFLADFEDVLELTTAIKKCSSLTQMAYSPEPDEPPLPREVFSELIHYHQLKKLSVDELHRIVKSECLVDLAFFLSQTTTLKEACLHFQTTAGSTKVLLDAISRNRSLSKLSICNWTFEPSTLRQLCALLRTNKILIEMYLQMSNCRERGVMYLLAGHLRHNLSLVNVTVHVDPQYDSYMAQLQIRGVTQRNLSTLHCAVQFVMGSHGRQFAEAFEKIFDLSSLVEAVQKSANEPEEQAKEMVKSSKRYLDRNFLAAVGVVKDTVACEPNGQVQLDCIGLDNWLQIRQYLTVANIKPEPAAGFYRRSLPRKRSRLH